MNFRRFTSQTASLPAKGVAYAVLTLWMIGFSALAFASTPIVNYKALQTVGLTGQGVTVQINSRGIKDLKAAETANALDATNTTVVGAPNTTSYGPLPDHAVYTAVVVHMIAPKAKIIICNDPNSRSCYSNGNQWNANVIVGNYEEGASEGESFAYGDPTSDANDGYEIAAINSSNFSNVLFYLAGSDTYGDAYFQGNWTPVSANVGGQSLTVEDFGQATGGASNTSISLGKDSSGTSSYPSEGLYLQWQDTATSDSPVFQLQVYDSSGTQVASGSCSLSYSPCVTIPSEPSTALPLKVYVVKTSGSVTGTLKMKLFIGSGGSSGNLYTVTPFTAGSVTPFIAGAGANAIITGGATSLTKVKAGSSRGGLLGFDTATDSFNTFNYPTLTGDWCLPIPKVGSVSGWYSSFCGNSNSSPELGAVAALLLQAGLTPSQIEQYETQTAINPNTSIGVWGATWGYGYEDPLSTLEQVVSLPLPAISGATGVSGTTGQSLSFSGSCSVASGYTVKGYAWKFGDGSTATGQSVTHTYNSAGAYTATLDCSETETSNGKVFDDAQPAQVTVDITSPPSKTNTGSGGGGSFGLTTLWVLCMLALALVYLRRLQEKGLIGKAREKGARDNDH